MKITGDHQLIKKNKHLYRARYDPARVSDFARRHFGQNRFEQSDGLGACERIDRSALRYRNRSRRIERRPQAHDAAVQPTSRLCDRRRSRGQLHPRDDHGSERRDRQGEEDRDRRSRGGSRDGQAEEDDPRSDQKGASLALRHRRHRRRRARTCRRSRAGAVRPEPRLGERAAARHAAGGIRPGGVHR